MPQRRRRTYIVGFLDKSAISQQLDDIKGWTLYDGILAKAFPFTMKNNTIFSFQIKGDIKTVSDSFNKSGKDSPFGTAGTMHERKVWSVDTVADYDGPAMTLGGCLVDESMVPDEFFIPETELPRWEYEKGAKKINRVSKEGYEYTFSEGPMAFPDSTDGPSRTIITGEGGSAPSRFKHVIKTPSGRYRRLIPLELERLNMFPDNHTYHPEVSDGRRAFLMGNALVCGVVKEIGKSLYRFIYGEAPVSKYPIDTKRNNAPTLDLGLFDGLPTELVRNQRKKTVTMNESKHLLIGFVKADNQDYFLDGGVDKLYYTGKTKSFPSTVALNKLYYFMPYIKGKGVKDIYLIKVARIGKKSEVQASSNDNDPRLVFELEYIKSLEEYKPIRLNIFQTYRDTTLGRILNIEV